jgi:hypothetical protein
LERRLVLVPPPDSHITRILSATRAEFALRQEKRDLTPRLFFYSCGLAAEVSKIASDAAEEAADVVQDVAKTVAEKKPTTA